MMDEHTLYILYAKYLSPRWRGTKLEDCSGGASCSALQSYQSCDFNEVSHVECA